MEFFTWDYSAEQIYDSENDIECYYLTNGVMAIGWVHNRNAWVTNNFYLRRLEQNLAGCDPPNVQPQEIEISGLFYGHDYYTYWFPTRMNTTECPADAEDFDGNNAVTLKIDSPLSMALGGTANNYLDTLHADYAFIIAPFPQVKSLNVPPPDAQLTATEWDFTLFPNPTRSEFFLRLSNEESKNISMYDLSGRQIQAWSSVTGPLQHLPIDGIAKGVYWIRVSDANSGKTKKLIIH